MRIIPAAGESGVVGALDIGGQRVADDQRVARGEFGDTGAHIIIIRF